jgi:alkylation response protein AidB-like acyl-CoA dehydrogenase
VRIITLERRDLVNIDLTPEELEFQQEFRAWLERNIPPNWDPQQVRGMSYGESFDLRREFERRMGRDGWLGVAWPVEYGGRGATLMEQVIYQQEMARAQAPGLAGHVGLQLVGPILMDVGTPEQRGRFLPPILRGEEIWYQGFSEPNAGSDLAGLQTRAVLDGDHWVLTGQKVWGGHAEHADWGAILVRTDPDVPKHKGISFLVVDMKSPGITVSYIRDMSGAANMNQVFFDQVRVPRENVIGTVNDGWTAATRLLGWERGVSTLEFVVRYENFWRRLREFACSTKRGGRRLSEIPHLREALARSYTHVRMMKTANLRWLAHYLRGKRPAEETSYMKLYWAAAHQALGDLALELGAADALEMPDSSAALYSGAFPVEWIQSRATTLLGGTQDIQRNIIAERILGLPRG